MQVSRLLALVMFFALCAGWALGQSQQNDPSNLVVFQGAASMNSANAVTGQLSTNSQAQIASSHPVR